MLRAVKGIKHVAWDWNGTLLDDTGACVASLNGMLTPRGLGPVTVAEYMEQFGFPVYDYYVRLGFDFGRDEWEKVAVEFHVLYGRLARDVQLKKGAVEALEKLKLRGTPMSILSASESTMLEQMLKIRGIDRFFAGVYARSDYYADSKVMIGKRMLERIGGDPGSVLMIGDTDHDWDVARELGFKCALVCGGHQSEHRLMRCGCDVLPDIESVADYVSEN